MKQNRGAIEDRNILGYTRLVKPHHLKAEMPLTEKAIQTVENGRDAIRAILRGEDNRIILVVGPCSTHDPIADRDYAERLNILGQRVEDKMLILKRTYFEKPRTTIDWKGLINEPYLDGREMVNDGLRIARGILAHNAQIGLLSATEFVDPFVPQWIGDLISWAAIGARTSQSPTHRQMSSGLSMPIGFKNGTSGDVQAAVDAVFTANHSQWFFGIDPTGEPSIVTARGNEDTHLILRGGDNGPNYDSVRVQAAQELLAKFGLRPNIMIDCSHGNSGKDHELQPEIFESVFRQIRKGNNGIIGLMLESNINPGRQDIPADPKTLQYGVSVTDACIGWDTTETLIMDAYKSLARR